MSSLAGRWTRVVFCAAALCQAPVDPRASTDVAAMTAALSAEVEQIRRLEFLRPVPLREIGDREAREHVLARLAKFQSGDEIAALERVYAILGLIPADGELLDPLLEVLGQQAGGFYDPDSDSFYLRDDVPPTIAPVVITHELTHALEDQHFDIDRRLVRDRGDDDRLLAHSAVHEGSAMLVMTIWIERATSRGEFDPAIAGRVSPDRVASAAGLDTLPEVLRRQLLAPYILGPAFIAGGRPAGMPAAVFPAESVDALYRDPPQSSEQILHPHKYWDAARRDEPREVELGRAGRALGRKWRLRHRGTLGELTLALLAGSPPTGDDGRIEWTNDPASGWGGDAWELWHGGGSAAVLLGTRWDTVADAREFADALAARGGLAWRRAGDRLAIAAGAVEDRADEVLERMLAEMKTGALVPSE
ncbi:MAG TPA: hypothetical protein VD788_06195 [Candidatus Polarisedimenticolaceae bacterium]|nr:hypothetical protein [Candidatus Polarisedimenticolaceae bacterium]